MALIAALIVYVWLRIRDAKEDAFDDGYADGYRDAIEDHTKFGEQA